MSDVAGLIERLREMAPEEGRTIRCNDRTTAMMNCDIREAATALQTLTDKVEALEEALRVGETFLDKCFSAWSCGEPYHRVKTMLDHADKFRDALAALTKEGKSA